MQHHHILFSMKNNDSPINLYGTYTYADYLTWKMDEFVELIQGKIFKMPTPPTVHQVWLGELAFQIGISINRKKNPLFMRPFDVRLLNAEKSTADEDIYTVVQPDICVICDPEKIDRRGGIGAPDFMIEVVSKSTLERDMHDKYALYEAAGVREYWVVFPQEKTVLVYDLSENGKYIPRQDIDLAINPLVKIGIFEALEIDFTDLLQLREYK